MKTLIKLLTILTTSYTFKKQAAPLINIQSTASMTLVETDAAIGQLNVLN